jgi:hypothetical protein
MSTTTPGADELSFDSEAEALAAIDAMVAQAERRIESAQQMVDALDRLEVGARGDDGTEVRLGHSGTLVGLTLGPRLTGADPATVGASVLAANARAQTRVLREVEALAATHYGADTEAAAAVIESYVDLFPDAAGHDPEETDRAPESGVLR